MNNKESGRNDPFYRLTANIPDASAEETTEILNAIENMSDDDLTIAHTERRTVHR